MYKVSLNKEHKQYNLFKQGLSFKDEGKVLVVSDNKSVDAKEVPPTVLHDIRFIVEKVESVKKEKKE